MSWLYSRALAEAFSAESCSAIRRLQLSTAVFVVPEPELPAAEALVEEAPPQEQEAA